MKPSPEQRTFTTTTRGVIAAAILLVASATVQAQVPNGGDLSVLPPGDSPALGVQASTAIPQEISTKLSEQVMRIEQIRTRLHDSHGFLRAADPTTLLLLFSPDEGKAALAQEYAPRFKAAGRPIPDQLFNNIDKALGRLWSEIARVADTVPAREGVAAPESLTRLVETQLLASIPKADFVGATLTDGQWSIKLNDLGIPVGRSVHGLVYYRVPSQRWLVAREFEVKQSYFTRASNGAKSDIAFGSIRLQRD